MAECVLQHACTTFLVFYDEMIMLLISTTDTSKRINNLSLLDLQWMYISMYT